MAQRPRKMVVTGASAYIDGVLYKNGETFDYYGTAESQSFVEVERAQPVVIPQHMTSADRLAPKNPLLITPEEAKAPNGQDDDDPFDLKNKKEKK